MSSQQPTIIYTLTDEAPLLATSAFLPVIRTFAAPAGINVTTADISVAGRVLAAFPECLSEEQRVSDDLAALGKLTLKPEANIIKLPNISASVAQLKAAISELQQKGYKIPDFPENPKTDEEKDIRARYNKCTGSAVNPVLREGNSDRRAPRAVKEYARKNPHSMGEWSQASRSHVSHMHHGDFYHGEKSMTLDKARDVKMELITKSGKTIVLKPKVALLDREVIDSMFMSKKALLDFYEKEIEDARKTGVMFSLHVKATMMKVSHPIVFGHCVRIFYREAFEKHGKLFDELGVNVNNGMVDLYNKITTLPQSKQDEIKRDLHACHEGRPELAMVDSAKGITNFHSPNDVIVDASMPAMIRNSGKMWGADGRLKDVKAVMPESTFARIYQEIINFCKWHGAFDPKTMGTVPNVGLMAQQAEVFWLDAYRPHEAQLITKVKMYLHEHNTAGLDIQIMSQVRAMRYTLERVIRGQDTISATGNILRDYLTDLFPIMELGTSAKMLSIVPLMAGGGMYETGAGGSAPKHVQQLVEENHLRWDSLGEFLALAVSFEDLGLKNNNASAKLLAKTLDAATGKLLDNNKNPSPKTGQLDNRGSQFYLALYWAQELAAQTEDKALAEKFAPLAKALTENEKTIVKELADVQGKPVDIGGYYKPDFAKLETIMRPSKTFNAALASLKA
jgi:monomeric isocitrate dehydrogenase